MPNSPRFTPNAGRIIDVLAFPAAQLLDVTGPVQVFASANDIVAGAGGVEPPCAVRVVAPGGGGVTASAGLELAAGPLTPVGESLDTLLVAAVMANSPVLINSLVGLFGNVHGGSFTEPQVQTVLLTDAVTNNCE
jgi:transcriptional regulator GlxA family with amidase domain